MDPKDWAEGLERNPIYSDNKALISKCKTAKYIKQNIPGPGYEQTIFEDKFEGCRCLSCDVKCKCLEPYGISYEKNKIKPEYLRTCGYPVFECNMYCTCSPDCENRVVQHGITFDLQVIETDNKGLGVKALENISCGKFVCEYAGEVISLAEARERTQKRKKNDMNYIMTIQEHHKSGILKTYVDPERFGNIGRYINHSCSPNLTMVPVRIDNMVPKICLFANRDIVAEEELSYQYGPLNRDMKGETPCNCNSDICTGYLPFDDQLHEK